MSDDQFNRLFNYMQTKFDEIDTRFETIDRRFEDIDKRLEEINSHFDIIDKKIDDNHDSILSKLDYLSGEVGDIKDELAVVGYKVGRLEDWASAFKF